jgi:uncharacterized protein YndB with AHSA1/START domain
MQSIERSVTVDRPLATVWEYLSDFTSTNEWDPGTVRTERRSGDGEVGTVYENTSKFLGRTTKLVYTVIEVEPQVRLKLRGENKSVTVHDTLSFEGDSTTTTVRYLAEFSFSGAAKLTEPLMSIPLKKLGDDAERKLGETLRGL